MTVFGSEEERGREREREVGRGGKGDGNKGRMHLTIFSCPLIVCFPISTIENMFSEVISRNIFITAVPTYFHSSRNQPF